MSRKALTFGSIASQTARIMTHGCDIGAALGIVRVLGLEVPSWVNSTTPGNVRSTSVLGLRAALGPEYERNKCAKIQKRVIELVRHRCNTAVASVTRCRTGPIGR